jgi:hypothetical protein
MGNTYLARQAAAAVVRLVRSPETFIMAHCRVRDDLEQATGPKWDAVIARVCEIRNELFSGFPPFRGRWFGDYVD